jgi:hypothetical protein
MKTTKEEKNFLHKEENIFETWKTAHYVLNHAEIKSKQRLATFSGFTAQNRDQLSLHVNNTRGGVHPKIKKRKETTRSNGLTENFDTA